MSQSDILQMAAGSSPTCDCLGFLASLDRPPDRRRFVGGWDFVASRSGNARGGRRNVDYSMRTNLARPSSFIRLSDLTAIATSVTRHVSSRDFKVSPMTRL